MVFMMYSLKAIFENTDTWETHSDAGHRFTVDFPSDWGRFDTATSQYQKIGVIEGAVQRYGSTDGSFNGYVGYMTGAERFEGENWATAVSRKLSLWNYAIINSTYKTYAQYKLSPQNGKKGLYYEVIAEGDTAVIIGYDVPSTLSTAIKASIRFTK